MLSPTTAASVQGTQQTLTAQFMNLAVPVNTAVSFTIGGANIQTRIGRTDASGTATVSYTGIFTGVDSVQAEATVGATTYRSSTGSITWTSGKHPTIVSLQAGMRSRHRR